MKIIEFKQLRLALLWQRFRLIFSTNLSVLLTEFYDPRLSSDL